MIEYVGEWVRLSYEGHGLWESPPETVIFGLQSLLVFDVTQQLIDQLKQSITRLKEYTDIFSDLPRLRRGVHFNFHVCAFIGSFSMLA